MFILGDKGHYHGRFPWVTTWLVVVNVVVFTAQVVIGDGFTTGFSMTPLEITTGQDLQGTIHRKVGVATGGNYAVRDFPVEHYAGPTPIFLTLLTSMFMHGSVLHLVFNMWFLLIFGRNVECAMGPKLFLGLYIACGLLASLAQVAYDVNSIIPCLGASGAIAGVMGAYISIHPTNKIKIWLGLTFIIEAPAFLVIGVWAVLQYVSAVSDASSHMGGIAYWAHLGGFFSGVVIVRLIVIYLRLRVGTIAPNREKSLMPVAPFNAAILAESSGDKAEAPDPFAGFITVQTMRRMQEKKEQERPR